MTKAELQVDRYEMRECRNTVAVCRTMALRGRREPPSQSDGLGGPSYGLIHHLASWFDGLITTVGRSGDRPRTGCGAKRRHEV